MPYSHNEFHKIKILTKLNDNMQLREILPSLSKMLSVNVTVPLERTPKDNISIYVVSIFSTTLSSTMEMVTCVAM